MIIEKQHKAGGLASSYRDEKGFLWDNGGHVVFSHYSYFDRLLNKAVKNWNKCSRASYAFMKGSSGKRKFIPYPVQNNVHVFDKEEQEKSLTGLENIQMHPIVSKPKNFDEWLLKHFGEGLSEVFMRKYNRKVWTVDPKEMNTDWVGERVAVPDVNEIKENIEQLSHNPESIQKAKDSNWGPNKMFTFPAVGGTGQIWESVSKFVPQHWFRFGQAVVSINYESKYVDILKVSDGTNYSMKFDYLISTAPLDNMLSIVEDSDSKSSRMKSLSQEFVYSHTHVIGLGLKGQPPHILANKSWVYFPDSDSPFYRVTVFSNYADDNVPSPGDTWSLMCEVAEPKNAIDFAHWEKDYLIRQTIEALITYEFIDGVKVLSTYHRRLEHGYPVPFLKREQYLRIIQPWLESKSIFSRGRFGGWRYEVGNQDHSLMQGVEIADFILFGTPEETYPNARLVNSMKASNRCVIDWKDYEVVVAHYDEDLSWLFPCANHCHIYHKMNDINIDKNTIKKFKKWDVVPNVGRESYVYLHHIIANYDRLANITIFFQGKIQEHIRWNERSDCNQDMNAFIVQAQKKEFYAQNMGGGVGWGKINHIGKWKKWIDNGQIARSKYLSLGEFWKALFGFPHPKKVVRWAPAALFSVSRSRILSRPKSFYKHAISFVDHHPNPEEGHYFERLFPAIFTYGL